MSVFLILLSSFMVGQDQSLKEEVRVIRYIASARVLDERGEVLLGLVPEDFLLNGAGKNMEIKTAFWVDDSSPAADPLEAMGETGASGIPNRAPTQDGFVDLEIDYIPTGGASNKVAPADKTSGATGRLMVFFIQNDIGSNRNDGIVKMIRHCKEILPDLSPADQVAVFSFDSRLKMFLDFTRDRAAASNALDLCLGKRPGLILEGGPAPSVADAFDDTAAAAAADMESALTLLTHTLETVPGEKMLALVGWGMGTLDARKVITNRRYDQMMAALLASEITVFSLDLSVADYHSLEVALKDVALSTGGFYERAGLQGKPAMKRFLAAIQGHYLLSFELNGPELPNDFYLTIKGHPRARVALSKSFMKKAPGPLGP